MEDTLVLSLEAQEENQSEIRVEQLTVASLRPDMKFSGYLLVRSAEQRTNAKGSKYLDLNLVDRTGEINCKKWDGTVAPPAGGSVVFVTGLVQEYNGRIQMRIDTIRRVNKGEPVDVRTLIPAAPRMPGDMMQEITDTVDGFENEDLRKICRNLLSKKQEELLYYPAAMRLHHAERSGLLHHMTDMLRSARGLLDVYTFLDRDLVLAGVILHDIAKIEEMKSDELGNVSDYTRDGLLVGHLARGMAMVGEAARETGVSGECVVLLEHMMLSHHGIPEYGSVRYPMFPEAELLHLVDTLDAKMNEMKGIEDRVPAGSFSEKIPTLEGRRVYHPLRNMHS
ncbi:MAG: HD domain-containing protein [Clostridia bacterium]|nr:HD domain-containing protein [Clostridia bacterium]